MLHLAAFHVLIRKKEKAVYNLIRKCSSRQFVKLVVTSAIDKCFVDNSLLCYVVPRVRYTGC
jgi:hypothetical protein